jgi:hypothetical protein
MNRRQLSKEYKRIGIFLLVLLPIIILINSLVGNEVNSPVKISIYVLTGLALFGIMELIRNKRINK